MKRIIYSIISLGFALGLASCQPVIQMPETSATPITSVTARVKYQGEFIEATAYPVEGFDIIEIEFPRFYPIDSDNQLPMRVLDEAKITMELANNVVVTEPVTIMNLNEMNTITVIDQVKKSHTYTITGRIAPLDLCEITSFVLSEELGLSAIVKQETKQIAILTDGLAGKGHATAVLSPRATIAPDPAVEEIDFDDPDLTFTVTADNKKDKTVYTVIKEIPPKREFGLRPESAKVIFAKQLYADLGIDVPHKTTGIAVSGTNLIINTQGKNPVVVDRYTGEKLSDMNIADLSSASLNYYMTSDDAGNILFNNFQAEDNILKVWVSKDVNTAPVEFISWNTEGAVYGKKLSVQGSLDGNAVITTPLVAAGADKFARWTVTGGELVSQTPEIVTVSGVSVWTWNCDLCYAGDTPDSDYFIHGYSGSAPFWVNGSTNAVKAKMDPGSVNFVPNAVDVIKFNRGMYMATNQANGASWGASDFVWLIDVSTADNFVGTLDAKYRSADDPALSETSPALFYECDKNTYGVRALVGTQGAQWLSETNAQYFADVLLSPSTEQDYYLNMYFMFCNGFVVGVQFDCFDM